MSLPMTSCVRLLIALSALSPLAAMAQHNSNACNELHKLPGGTAAPTQVSGYIRKGPGEFGSPRKQGTKTHTGVDIILEEKPSQPEDWAVRSIAAGTVAHARWGAGYGEVIGIDHGNGCYTLYAHVAGEPFSPIKPGGNMPVKLGDKVAAGQKLGYVRNAKADLDSTGNAESLPEPFNLQVHIELIAAPAGRKGDGKLGETIKSGTYEVRDPTVLLNGLKYAVK